MSGHRDRGLDRFQDLASAAPSLVAERVGPRRSTDLVVQADQDQVEIVEVTELTLKAGQRGCERAFVLGVEGGGQVGELSGPADADPQPVKALHRRAAARLSVGTAQFVVRANVR